MNIESSKVGSQPRIMFWEDIETTNKIAEKRKYNRQIDLSKLKKEVKKSLKKRNLMLDDTMFPATALMVHSHQSGEKCPPHMRISIYAPENISVIVDCDMSLWESFSKI